MAKRCARLAVLAFAAARGAGAQDQDAVALVQHKLESQSALEDMPSDDVATVMSSFINMLKFENLIRESVFSEDAAATTKRVNFARDIPDEDVPPFKMPESIMHESKMPKSKAAAVESVQAEGTLGSGYWNIAKGKTLSQAVMTRAGESCSSQDLARMHKALEDYRHLAEEKGPTSIQYAIHPICKEALGLVINYTKFDTCVQKTLEVSPGCSKCHVNVMKGSMASDIFHPKCSLMCMNAMGSCPVEQDEVPSQKCMASLGKCMDCAMPEVRKQAPCIGGILNNKETLDALQTLAAKLRKGKMSSPAEFRSAIEEVYDEAEKIA